MQSFVITVEGKRFELKLDEIDIEDLQKLLYAHPKIDLNGNNKIVDLLHFCIDLGLKEVHQNRTMKAIITKMNSIQG